MGYSNAMWAAGQAAAVTIGTITLDSCTRGGDHAAAQDALGRDMNLNSYPIVHPRPRQASRD